jgi:hypothetical protein
MWFFKSEKEKIKIEYNKGFDHAASEILKGEPIETLESYVEISRVFNNYGPFDSGVEDAIFNYKNLLRKNKK